MTPSSPSTSDAGPGGRESLGRLFFRFLRFGCLAWGGPVAQLDMIRHELVDEEKWVTPAHFRRLLGIYQVLPGPEAHEMCVHLGMIARGRAGGLLAGLGFMLPGFVLMFLLSWAYLRFGLGAGPVQAVFGGIQPAVVALIVRACHRIGAHALVNPALGAIAAFALVAERMGLPFWLPLVAGGVGHLLAGKRRWVACAVLAAVVFAVGWGLRPVSEGAGAGSPSVPARAALDSPSGRPSLPAVFGSGLRTGLLTFGGAYTAIPFLKEDAVEKGRWLTEPAFLDGVALTGVIPAPLIIFSTFVGYHGAGPAGALVMTLGVFLPAFGFSLLFHRRLEAVVANAHLHAFLEGVAASVVGLIVGTTLALGRTALTSPGTLAVFASALAVLYLWKSKAAVPVVIVAAGTFGILLA